MTLLVRFMVAPFLPRENRYRTAHAGRSRGARARDAARSLRADRALVVLLPAIVLVDLVYRQLYTTLPLHLRDARRVRSALYATLNAIGSGLILLLEIPVALRPAGGRGTWIVAVGYALVGLGFALFGLPVTVVTAVLGDGGADRRRGPSTRRRPRRTCSSRRRIVSWGSTRGCTRARRPPARCWPGPWEPPCTPPRPRCCGRCAAWPVSSPPAWCCGRGGGGLMAPVSRAGWRVGAPVGPREVAGLAVGVPRWCWSWVGLAEPIRWPDLRETFLARWRTCRRRRRLLGDPPLIVVV